MKSGFGWYSKKGVNLQKSRWEERKMHGGRKEHLVMCVALRTVSVLTKLLSFRNKVVWLKSLLDFTDYISHVDVSICSSLFSWWFYWKYQYLCNFKSFRINFLSFNTTYFLLMMMKVDRWLIRLLSSGKFLFCF